MILRKPELEALRELITQEFADEDAYIKAIANAIERFLLNRDSWGVGVRFGARTAPFGPIYHKGTAASLAKGWASAAGFNVTLQQLNSPTKLELQTAKHMPSPYCHDCGHPKLAHNWPGGTLGRGCLCGTVWSARGKPNMKDRCNCMTER